MHLLLGEMGASYRDELNIINGVQLRIRVIQLLLPDVDDLQVRDVVVPGLGGGALGVPKRHGPRRGHGSAQGLCLLHPGGDPLEVGYPAAHGHPDGLSQQGVREDGAVDVGIDDLRGSAVGIQMEAVVGGLPEDGRRQSTGASFAVGPGSYERIDE